MADEPAARVPKEQAEYSPGMPDERCSLCSHFMRPQACSIVKGLIGSGMWCKFFDRKGK